LADPEVLAPGIPVPGPDRGGGRPRVRRGLDPARGPAARRDETLRSAPGGSRLPVAPASVEEARDSPPPCHTHSRPSSASQIHPAMAADGVHARRPRQGRAVWTAPTMRYHCATVALSAEGGVDGTEKHLVSNQ
jgi:hypothetical protein